MTSPNWQQLELAELADGILRERVPDPNRVVLWLPGPKEKGCLTWERVGSVPGTDGPAGNGVWAASATSVPARQKKMGLLSKLFARSESAGAQSWVVPSGGTAEQAGERRTDLILAWAEPGGEPLDEGRVKSQWPEARQLRRLGRNLFLVAGVKADAAGVEATREDPAKQAQTMLAAARQKGDRRAEATALTDLAISLRRHGQAPVAVQHLDQALGIARQLGDPYLEADVLENLGMALLEAGQPSRALEFFDHALATARAAGNRFVEKTVLEDQGQAFSALGEPARATAVLEQALTLARELGDRTQQADLLWLLAIQAAELDRRDQALDLGKQAIALWKTLRSPHVDQFEENLEKYRLGGPITRLTPVAGEGFAGAGTAGIPPRSHAVGSGPSWLRMAFSAAKSMARFIGSGAKVVSSVTYQRRLRTCETCEHHTGVRCRVCGCFTAVKGWMPHENCPLGKWPA